jgi:dihydropteroate synthase
MGVLNVTPDSFSDGGRFFDHAAAVDHGLNLHSSGADLIDVGGESTRPGAEAVDAAEESRRVVPVVRDLVAAGASVSVDTSKPEVAAEAVAAGAVVINDVSALSAPGMIDVAVDSGAGVILMHMKGTPRTMQQDPRYDDVVGEVTAFLTDRAAAVIEAGVSPEAVCLDPGIGFGKTLAHNLTLLRHGLPALAETPHFVGVGASRKSFIEGLLGRLPAEDRDPASAAAHVLAISGGVDLIRVHNVVMGLRTARMADAIVRASR